jgi:hypothetical protein
MTERGLNLNGHTLKALHQRNVQILTLRSFCIGSHCQSLPLNRIDLGLVLRYASFGCEYLHHSGDLLQDRSI